MLALGVVTLAMAGPARAGEVVRIDQVSHKSFQDTVKHLEWGFGGHGLTVVAQLDYANMLKKIGVHVRRSRMFEVMRRPWAKTVFAHDSAAALDIPVRIYVYERDDGKTVVSYYRPSTLFSAYGKDRLRELGEELDTAVREMVHVATKQGAARGPSETVGTAGRR